MDALVSLFVSENFSLYRNVAAVIGVLYVLRVLLNGGWLMLSNFCAYFLAPLGILRTDLKKYGKWAVVTGASEGIGKGYAMELARQGLNVVIMSRSQEKLQLVADEIHEKYHREVHIIVVDFSDGQKVYPRIAAELKDRDIGILVNNVGYSYEFPDFFANVDHKRHYNIIELNCQTVIQMTKLVLPWMLEKQCGAIINISSASSYQPVPLLNTYAASKIFVNYFSDALYKEYCSKGIYVQTVTPYFVATTMSGIRRTSFFIPDPVSATRAAVATIGIQNTAIGCFPHAIMDFMRRTIPSFVNNKLSWSALMAARQRSMRRKAKQLSVVGQN